MLKYNSLIIEPSSDMHAGDVTLDESSRINRQNYTHNNDEQRDALLRKTEITCKRLFEIFRCSDNESSWE